MPQGTRISFVTFPDGIVDERSLTVCGEEFARTRCINAWLPDHLFGRGLEGYAAERLWHQMREKGFKVHTIEMVGGEPKLVKP